MKENCRVVKDTAGWTGHPRLTCVACEDTIVRQPWMTSPYWENKVKEFKDKHKNEAKG